MNKKTRQILVGILVIALLLTVIAPILYITTQATSVTQNDIHIMKEENIQSSILLLTEQSFLKRGISNKIGNISKNIIGELYFKSSFKLCRLPILFNKEEPSEESIANLSTQIKTMLYGK